MARRGWRVAPWPVAPPPARWLGRWSGSATIGVHPSHWRRGLATRLLRPVVELARELGAPAYLETSSTGNLALYERNGFEVIGEATVPGGGPRVWAMQA